MAERRCVHEGTCYPTRHVGAVLDGRKEAEAAAETLRGAGFADVALFHGQEAYAAIRDRRTHDGVIKRAWRRIRDLGEEGELHQHYLSVLRRGGSYLIVYAGTPAQADHARDILAQHHARDIWRLGSWIVERLPERSGDQR